MKNELELTLEHQGDTYSVDIEFEAVYEQDFAPHIEVDVKSVYVWDGEDDIEVSFLDLPTDVREHIEEVALYRAEREYD